MLTPPPNVLTKEAIYCYGPLGSAKTTFWATIADWYRRTGTPGQFHAVATEKERITVALEAYSDWPENVTVYEVDDFDGVMAACEKIHGQAARDDWMVVDTVGFVKDWIRADWFTKNLDLTWQDFKMSGKSMKEVAPHNWTQMNTVYERWCRQWLMGFPGHRCAVAQAAELANITTSGSDWDKGHIRDTYGRYGLKPDAYKGDDSFFHTVLLAGQVPRQTQKFSLTTVKDRPGRQYLDREELMPLPFGAYGTYLTAVAGWTDIT